MTGTKDDEIYEIIHSRSWHRPNHYWIPRCGYNGWPGTKCFGMFDTSVVFWHLLFFGSAWLCTALHGFGSCAEFKRPYLFLELLRASCGMLFVDHERDDSFESQNNDTGDNAFSRYGQVIQRPVGSLNIWSEPKLQVPTACCSTKIGFPQWPPAPCTRTTDHMDWFRSPFGLRAIGQGFEGSASDWTEYLRSNLFAKARRSSLVLSDKDIDM